MHQLPNILTVIRILLVIPFAYLTLSESYRIAFWVFVFAGVSDAIDGFLARQFHWRSRFGEIVDPIADKLLLVTTYLALTWVGVIPVWVVALIFGRDFVIVVGGLLYHYRLGKFEIEPSIWGKLCTFTQIAFVVLLLTQLAGYIDLEPFLEYGIHAVVFVTLFSGIHYVIIWARRAKEALKANG